jgi:uroporphyrinogen decarboxylase
MYTLPMEARLELAGLLSRKAADDFMIFASCPGIIGMPGSSEYLEFSYKLFDAPEEIDERARQRLAVGIETAKKLRDSGVEAVYSGADIATNKGPWFSPDNMDRFIYPYLEQWSDSLRSIGLYAILHTDGDISRLLPRLTTCGIHAVQALDPVAGMNMADAKQLVDGKLCLCGNVDCGMLIVGSRAEIYESVCGLLEQTRAGGGVVLGASNAVVIETPIDNYREVIRAWRDKGQYG